VELKHYRSLTNFGVSVVLSVAALCIVFSFRNYFIFAPFQQGVSLLSILQFSTIIGWVLLVFAPPLFFFDPQPWSKSKQIAFYVCVGFWTAAVTGIKIYQLLTIGQFFAEYLFRIPVMFFFEWILPVLYILIARNQLQAFEEIGEYDEDIEEDSIEKDSKLL
jgi:hypothetical protein